MQDVSKALHSAVRILFIPHSALDSLLSYCYTRGLCLTLQQINGTTGLLRNHVSWSAVLQKYRVGFSAADNLWQAPFSFRFSLHMLPMLLVYLDGQGLATIVRMVVVPAVVVIFFVFYFCLNASKFLR